MKDRTLMHRRNILLFILITVFYVVQVTINIFIEGLLSVFPPAFLFVAFVMFTTLLIHLKINPKITMYIIISYMYFYFYFLLKDSPFLVNYLFMWLALPLSAIYQNYRVVVISGIASIMLTCYAYFNLHEEIFPNVGTEDFIYLILFGLFITTFIIVFIYKLNEANAKLEQLAYHDPLTGAANRLLLQDRFDMLKHKEVDSIALFFIDMNGFKKINDTYGHEAGDQLLEKTVTRLTGVLSDKALLCRLGGDEFVILTYNIEKLELERISMVIQLALEEPILLKDQKIIVTASIGWHYTTEISAAELDQLINEADQAMYRVKSVKSEASHDLEFEEIRKSSS